MRLSFGALALLALALPGTAADHVVLVSIDGFAAYHLYNQELEAPNIRALIAGGVWAASSETVFPSVTHPSHTTMVTGVEPRLHGVLSNGLTNRETGESFHPTNKSHAEIVKVPTIFDAAKKKGLSTASFFWPETKDDPSIDFNIPEVFTPDHKGEISAVDPKVLDELENAGVAIHRYFEWYGTERQGACDIILAEAAGYVIKKYKPGLLTIHLLVTDETQHTYGPHHYLSQAAITMADAAVGVIRKAIDDAGIADDTVLIVGADHGFHSVYYEMNTYPAFKKAGLLDRVELRGGGWMQSVRLKDNFDPKRDQAKLDAVFAELLESPYVARVVRPGEFHALGQPEFDESPYAFGNYLILPDIDTYLILDKDSDSMERHKKLTPSHSHGYLPTHPRMYPSMVLWGDGIRKGETIGHVKNLDLAPTISKLLGLGMTGMQGRVIEDALAP